MKKILFALSALALVPTLAAHAQVSSATILELVNGERRAAGLNDVTENDKLDQAAQMKASDMAAKGYFEHNTPDGKTPWDFYSAVGYDWSWAGEILAMDSQTEDNQAIVDAWMSSPEHKKIIMDGRYAETGIGVAVGNYQGQRVVFVAEEFGVPKLAASQVRPVVEPVVEVNSSVSAKVISISKAVVKSAEPTVEAVTTASAVESLSPPEPTPTVPQESWIKRLISYILSRFP